MKVKTVGVVKGAMTVAVICLSTQYPQAFQHVFLLYYVVLHVPEALENTVLGSQLAVCAAFGHFSFIDNHYPVGIFDGA